MLASALTFAPGCGSPRRRSRASTGSHCVAATFIFPHSQEPNDDQVGASTSSPVKPCIPRWRSPQTSNSTITPSHSEANKSFYIAPGLIRRGAVLFSTPWFPDPGDPSVGASAPPKSTCFGAYVTPRRKAPHELWLSCVPWPLLSAWQPSE